jgi:hypothetical protein
MFKETTGRLSVVGVIESIRRAVTVGVTGLGETDEEKRETERDWKESKWTNYQAIQEVSLDKVSKEKMDKFLDIVFYLSICEEVEAGRDWGDDYSALKKRIISGTRGWMVDLLKVAKGDIESTKYYRAQMKAAEKKAGDKATKTAQAWAKKAKRAKAAADLQRRLSAESLEDSAALDMLSTQIENIGSAVEARTPIFAACMKEEKEALKKQYAAAREQHKDDPYKRAALELKLDSKAREKCDTPGAYLSELWAYGGFNMLIAMSGVVEKISKELMRRIEEKFMKEIGEADFKQGEARKNLKKHLENKCARITHEARRYYKDPKASRFLVLPALGKKHHEVSMADTEEIFPTYDIPGHEGSTCKKKPRGPDPEQSWLACDKGLKCDLGKCKYDKPLQESKNNSMLGKIKIRFI